MTKRKIRIAHDRYTVHTTDEFDRSLVDAYKYLVREQTQAFADRWLAIIEAFVKGLSTPKTLGEIDPKHFSDTYAHYQIQGTQTTVFFLVESAHIYLVTSGYSGRDWPAVLKEVTPETDRQIAQLKTRRKPKKI